MVTSVVTTVTALEAQAAANLFLSNNLPDRFCADDPLLEDTTKVWRVPVVLAYPLIGPIGRTGEILVSATSGEVISSTPLTEMKAIGKSLLERHRDAIEAAFLQAIDA
jgi:hypothetical protein